MSVDYDTADLYDNDVFEHQVFDPDRDAPIVQCENGCGHYDVASLMYEHQDAWYCPTCYWTEESAARQFAIDGGIW